MGFPSQAPRACSLLGQAPHEPTLQHLDSANHTSFADCHRNSGACWVWLLHLPLHSCPGILIREKWDGYDKPHAPFFSHKLPLNISDLCWEQVIWTMDTWDPSSFFLRLWHWSEYILPCLRPQSKYIILSLDFRNPCIELQNTIRKAKQTPKTVTLPLEEKCLFPQDFFVWKKQHIYCVFNM